MRSALARSRTLRGPAAVANDERPLELVLEQPLDHVAPLLDLERERALGEPGRGGRAEQVRPLERAVRLGQRRQLRSRRRARTARPPRRRSPS